MELSPISLCVENTIAEIEVMVHKMELENPCQMGILTVSELIGTVAEAYGFDNDVR